MASGSQAIVLKAWTELESDYQSVRSAAKGFIADATLIGTQMIQDVATRVEYMRMIRAEADQMLAYARTNRAAARLVFDRIFARRNELRLIAQGNAGAAINILSKLITKDPTKYELLVRAANTLAEEGLLPGVTNGKVVKSIPLEKLSQDQLDDVFLKAIDKAGGSRKSITPLKMKMRGAGLLLLSVAVAGLDVYMSQDKSFAITKNVTSIAAGAGGAWAFAAAGLVVGGPVGGLVGLIVGGIVGSYAGEEVHYAVRGLHSRPEIDMLIARYYGIGGFDEDGFGRALHTEFLGAFDLVYIAFSNLDEKRNSDADDVASAYIEAAQMVCLQLPNGALAEGLRSPIGQALAATLYQILDDGWTTAEERAQMQWLLGLQKG